MRRYRRNTSLGVWTATCFLPRTHRAREALLTLKRELPVAPSPDAIRAARAAAGHTQTEAAELVHSTLRRWQEWEAGDHRMHPGLWELYRIKIGRDGLRPRSPR